MFQFRYRLFRHHWTLYLYNALIGSPQFYLLLRHAHDHQYKFVRNWKEALLPSTLPDKYSDDLIRIVEDELFTISLKRKYPISKSKFKSLLVDKFDSQTYGCFDMAAGSAFLTFSARLALTDINTIREYYPNLYNLFKEIAKVSRGCIETALINDNDLEKVLLSENAKKFAISRELLFADSLHALIPTMISSFIFACGWLVCRYYHQKLGGYYTTFLIMCVLAILLHYFLLKWYFIYEMLSLDEEAAKIDNDHFNGGIEYFNSNIELCKFLHQIIVSPKDFTKEGNFLQDPISFTERLEYLNKLKRKPN